MWGWPLQQVIAYTYVVAAIGLVEGGPTEGLGVTSCGSAAFNPGLKHLDFWCWCCTGWGCIAYKYMIVLHHVCAFH
jgi:hypothetical protein